MIQTQFLHLSSLLTNSVHYNRLLTSLTKAGEAGTGRVSGVFVLDQAEKEALGLELDAASLVLLLTSVEEEGSSPYLSNAIDRCSIILTATQSVSTLCAFTMDTLGCVTAGVGSVPPPVVLDSWS